MLKKMIASSLLTMLMLFTFLAHADDASPKVKESMTALMAETAKLGTPKVESGVLYFGTAKINDDFTVVDAIKTRLAGTATLFVKKDNGFVRISTNVMKNGNRAIGTQLDPAGPAIAAIREGKAYYGIVDILGKLFDTGYEPIKDASGAIVGIYYVGYLIE